MVWTSVLKKLISYMVGDNCRLFSMLNGLICLLILPFSSKIACWCLVGPIRAFSLSLPESLKSTKSTSLFKHSLSVLLTAVWSGINELCTFMPYALCTLHFIVYYCYYHLFTMGGQLRWALCLSGNHPLCVLLLSLFSATYLLYCGE